MNKPNFSILSFLEKHPVFTIDELSAFLSKKTSSKRVYNIILHNRKRGRIGMIKQGLYYRTRAHETPKTAVVDSYLIASKLTEDAILGFHTAFELLGAAHSQFFRMYYLTQTPRRAFTFRNVTFQAVQTPRKLISNKRHRFGTEQVERLGQPITITGRERTLVDCLERPEYCGGWEEVYRCAEKLPYLRFDVLRQYLDLKNQKILFAKTGFFLEQHRKAFFVEESFLQQLEKQIPTQPLYLEGREKKGRLVERWNLVVPEAILNRNWEEF